MLARLSRMAIQDRAFQPGQIYIRAGCLAYPEIWDYQSDRKVVPARVLLWDSAAN